MSHDISEENFADQIGLPRHRIRDMRDQNLDADEDWYRGESGRIFLRRTGMQKIVALLNVPEDVPTASEPAESPIDRQSSESVSTPQADVELKNLPMPGGAGEKIEATSNASFVESGESAGDSRVVDAVIHQAKTAKKPETRVVEILRVWADRPRQMLGLLDGKRVRVDVKSTTGFMRGMRLRCTGSGGIWKYKGVLPTATTRKRKQDFYQPRDR